MIYSTQEELDAALAYWQPLLHLKDWDIRAQLKSGDDLEVQGECRVFEGRKEALIRLREPQYHAGVNWDLFPVCMERTLVHELVHVHLWPLNPDKEKDPRGHDYLEIITDTLAKAFVLVKREAVVDSA